MRERVLALDVFRGLTVAGMILVNNPGDWSHVYAPLLHAKWHGATPTDWIFPFFLFIVGVAIPLAIDKRLERGVPKGKILSKIVSRTLIIFGIGLYLAAFPNFGMSPGLEGNKGIHYIGEFIFVIGLFFLGAKASFKNEKRIGQIALTGLILGFTIMLISCGGTYDLSSTRIPGVLQRIAIVYGICATFYLYLPWKRLLYLSIGILLFYWILMTLVPVPDGHAPNLEPETNLGAWLDRLIFGNHLWIQSKTWDPEGLLSTLPAISTGFAGIFTALWIKSERTAYHKLSGILGMGTILVALGWIWHLAFPINKQLWTSSYVIYTAGVALLFLGIIYWLTDILGHKKWGWPFQIYGTNALFVFVLSGFIAKLFYKIFWYTDEQTKVTLGSWIYKNGFAPYFSAYNASLAYAIANVLFFLLLSWLLYRNKIFIKI